MTPQQLMTLYVATNCVMSASMISIACAVIFSTTKRKLQYPWLAALFAGVFMCSGLSRIVKMYGAAHVPSIGELTVDVVGGALSAITTFLIWPIAFRALTMPSYSDLQAQRNELEHTQKLFDSFMEHSPVMACIKDSQNRIVYANREYLEAFNLKTEQVVGSPDLYWLPEQIAKILSEDDLVVLRDRKKIEVVRQIPLANGDSQEFLIAKFPIQNRVDTLIGVVALNITHRREINELNKELQRRVYELAESNTVVQAARDQALEASNLKSAFVANISHELRTPLSGIIGMAELMVTDKQMPPDTRMMAETIFESSKSLLAIVNDILDLSKIESGLFTVDYASFRPRDLLEDAVRLLRSAAGNKGLVINLNYESEIPAVVWGDEARLRQVLLNLIGNAIKFTEKGAIYVNASVLDQNENQAIMKFRIRDTGIGIALSDHKYLFKPFVQVDNSSTRRFGGTGLGLTISKKLVNLMGGEIQFESEPGKGTTFWFTVSLDKQRMHEDEERDFDRALQPIMEPVPLDLSQGRRILLVEDSPALADLVRRQMSSLGVQCKTVEFGAKAIELFSKEEFDLIFMDINLPDLSGHVATSAIRALEASKKGHKRVPIVAMTAGAMPGDRDKALNAGMDDYLAKPVSMDQLRAMLMKWLSPPQSRTRPERRKAG